MKKKFNINYRIELGDSQDLCSCCCFNPERCSDLGFLPCGSEFVTSPYFCILCKE